MKISLKTVLLRLLTLGVGLLVALALAEAACKVIDVRESWKNQRIAGRISRVSDIPGVRYELVPNITTKTPGRNQLIRINNLGFRGPDVAPHKPSGTYRIAVLGDSITFGRPHPEENLYPFVLERLLNEDACLGRVEVINAGLSGRDTWEEGAILEHKILPLDPDLVILEICLNDHVKLPFPKKNSTVGIFGEQAWYEYSSLLKLMDERLRGFRRYHLAVVKRLGLDRRSAERVILDHYIDGNQMLDVEPHWDEWRHALLRIRDLGTARGADVLFVVFPTEWQVKRGDTESMSHLTRLAREENISLIDLIGPFGAAEKRVLADYTHPNTAGHRLVAKVIEEHILAHLPSDEPGS